MISQGNMPLGHVGCQKAWVGSKKSVQQGRSLFDALSVLGIREHGKMARTPLVAFFNRALLTTGDVLQKEFQIKTEIQCV